MQSSVQATRYPSVPDAQGLTTLLAAHLVPKLHLRDATALLCTSRWTLQLVTQGAGKSSRLLY